MRQRCASITQPRNLAPRQVNRMAIDRAFAQQTKGLVSIQIITRLRVETLDPFHLVDLFGQMGLHQRLGAFAPQIAKGAQLCLGRGGGKARRDRIKRAAHPVPFVQQRLAVVIGGLRRVAQEIRRGLGPVHTGLARNDPHPALGGGLKKGIDAAGVDRAETCQRRRAMRQRQIQRAVCHRTGIGGVGKACLLGEGIGVQPVDQPFAPAGDNAGLRVMHMGVDEPGRDQRVAIIGDLRIRVAGAEAIRLIHGSDHAALQQHSAAAAMVRHGRPFGFKRVTVK
ncbi:hypothetical protein KVU_1784 [Ketogulonicigenium vulgare WSH-001]|uniref:Uncharacterized protein n=1 Tax=Ketogulonicigenium vulgare (strain WSH-001) TaxID=759362 RepID=F9Y3K3_KETVW|nr:hypothetical protein KVU_1784 [Ketogulonicigenium vulgare WSH-001]